MNELKSQGSSSSTVEEGGQLRIAITHPTCWPEVRRGSERFVYDFSHFLARRGHDVTVISTTPDGGGRTEYDGPVRRLLLPRRGPPLRFGTPWLSFSHRFAWQLASVLPAGGYDAVHCLHYHDAWGAAMARRRGSDFRFVFQLTGIPLRRYFLRVPLDGWIFHAAVCRADSILAASRYVQRMLRFEYGREGRLLPPPTDTTVLAGIVRPQNSDGPRILFVGDADVPRKGAMLLAKAFVLLRRDFPSAQLEYSGHASDVTRAAILDAVPQALRPDIAFLGIGPVEALPEIYARATVVVNPAIWEAFGMVLVEGLAAGTPVVGCDHAGIPDIIDDPRIGRLFAPQSVHGAATNVEGLADAVRQTVELAARPETAGLCRARAECFAWNRLGPYYEAALSGNG